MLLTFRLTERIKRYMRTTFKLETTMKRFAKWFNRVGNGAILWTAICDVCDLLLWIARTTI